MATASNIPSAGTMEENLTCSICQEVLNDPRTLPCMHSYCSVPCLQKYVDKQREKQKGKVIESFPCPECRTPFVLKVGDKVGSIKPNHFVGNMLEIFKVQQQPQSLLCSSCETKPAAVCRCLTCEQQLCNECLSAHNNWPAFQGHKTMSIEELMKPENISQLVPKRRCTKHPEEKLNLYCETCQELVCTVCVLLEHTKPKHSCKTVKEVVENKKEKLRQSTETLDKQFKKCSEALRQMEKITEVLEENKEKTINDIKRTKEARIKEFIQKAEREADRMTEIAEEKFDDISRPLQHQKDQMKCHVEQIKSSTVMAKDLLKDGSNEDIISIQKEIEENVERTTKEGPRTTRPIHSGMIKFQSKPITCESLLNKLGDVVCDPIKTVEQLIAEEKIQRLCDSSNILNGQNEYGKTMMEWVDKNFKWRLCYQASKHGWSARDFHDKCDDKEATLVLVKVNEYIGGGYTDQNWAGEDVKKSDKSFLFSLKNKDKLPAFQSICKGSCAIISNPDYGPIFGNGDLFISNNSNNNNKSSTNFGYSYLLPPGYLHSRQSRRLLFGSFKFTPSEIEVFY